jgi:hypothetical protein
MIESFRACPRASPASSCSLACLAPRSPPDASPTSPSSFLTDVVARLCIDLAMAVTPSSPASSVQAATTSSWSGSMHASACSLQDLPPGLPLHGRGRASNCRPARRPSPTRRSSSVPVSVSIRLCELQQRTNLLFLFRSKVPSSLQRRPELLCSKLVPAQFPALLRERVRRKL